MVGGIGGYYLDGRLTSTGLVYYPPGCGYWWCWPGSVGPGTLIRGSESTTEFGYNLGLGLTFEMGSGSQLYLEAKYHRIETDPVATEYVPLVVGYRW